MPRPGFGERRDLVGFRLGDLPGVDAGDAPALWWTCIMIRYASAGDLSNIDSSTSTTNCIVV